MRRRRVQLLSDLSGGPEDRVPALRGLAAARVQPRVLPGRPCQHRLSGQFHPPAQRYARRVRDPGRPICWGVDHLRAWAGTGEQGADDLDPAVSGPVEVEEGQPPLIREPGIPQRAGPPTLAARRPQLQRS